MTVEYDKAPERPSGISDRDAVVYLVEDDASMRESLVFVLSQAGFHVRAFESPAHLLETYEAEGAGCLVLDFQMPGMTGLQLLKTLQSRGSTHPFVVITGHGTIRAAVEAMHLGAVDFIEKPFHHDVLLSRVEQALAKDQADRAFRRDSAAIEEQFLGLTTREREVMQMVVEGELTKNIARKLGISVKTVEVHRSNITRKMGVDSVVQLVRMATAHQLFTRSQE
jgi:two-component system, LuxR family, response regulator FixJ